MVTLKLHSARLLLSSTASHVTVVTPAPNNVPEAGVHVTATFGSHRSVAVVVKVTGVPDGLVHSTVRFVEQAITGAVVSATVTVNEHPLVFPLPSATVQLTVVCPSPNIDPLAGSHTAVRPLWQLSLTVTSNVTTAPSGPVPSALIGAGQLITGAVVSSTVTVKLQLFVFPLPSTAWQFTVVNPAAKSEPEAGWQLTAGLGSQMSLATVSNMTAVPPGLSHSTVTSWAQVMLGMVLSRIFTRKLHWLLLLLLSVTEHCTVFVPSGKTVPDSGVQVTVRLLSQLSVAVTVNSTTLPAGLTPSAT